MQNYTQSPFIQKYTSMLKVKNMKLKKLHIGHTRDRLERSHSDFQ